MRLMRWPPPVEEIRKPNNLWVALLGYNEAIVDPDFRYLIPEIAEFPRQDLVARDFKLISDNSSKSADRGTL